MVEVDGHGGRQPRPPRPASSSTEPTVRVLSAGRAAAVRPVPADADRDACRRCSTTPRWRCGIRCARPRSGSAPRRCAGSGPRWTRPASSRCTRRRSSRRRPSRGRTSSRIDYFGRPAYLAQSPQFYKQTMVGVFERVYEVGPVFRAEPHDTVRHLAQYTSLDVELGFIARPPRRDGGAARRARRHARRGRSRAGRTGRARR